MFIILETFMMTVCKYTNLWVDKCAIELHRLCLHILEVYVRACAATTFIEFLQLYPRERELVHNV
jgi:hypothetical protein